MATYTVPAQHGGQIPLQTQDRDHLSTLDVVWANKYENEIISPTNAEKMEFEFYKGAPPQWLNFYWAEHKNSPFVRRDLYDELQEKIQRTRSQRRSIAKINLLHDPGSGGSTLAMQLLWDQRKKLRCAKLLDSTMDTRAIAKQVLLLFRAGGLEKQNTVLLLLDGNYTNEEDLFQVKLEEKLCDEIKANNITAAIPVVIILNCLHHTDLTEGAQNVTLSSTLSEAEQERYTRKKSSIIQNYGDSHTKLYAFNIMQSNYDSSYVTEVCRNLQPFKKKNRPCNQQLLAFLALVNSYVPGSDLPQDLCQMFLRRERNNLDQFSFDEHMKPYTDFLVLFSTKEEKDKSETMHVRMVHPMIAQECLRLLTDAGVTRSDTTLKLMVELGRNYMPPILVKTIKGLLTKRVRHDRPTKFSRLILDIKTEEQESICFAVLKMASKTFTTDPFFPQALARFCYIEINNYAKAKHWAEMAVMRDENNSFIRDTLGQVHKNHLRNVVCKGEKDEAYARKILHNGKKATEVFQVEENVAKKEGASEMQAHGITTISTIFNNRGIFGYMQVANILFDHITPLDSEWSMILSEESAPHNFLNSYGKGKCQKYKDFITSLRKNVELKFEFFEWYLLYSKPSNHKDEPEYFKPEVDKCYRKFVTQSQQDKSALQILKEQKASTFAGLLNKQAQNTELELITELWEDIFLHSQSDLQNILNYIVANVMLSQRNDASTALRPLEELQAMLQKLWTEQKDKRSPEFYLLALLLFWPDSQHNRPNSLNISECIRYMRNSFETTYKHYLRSRYLVPLFFLSASQGPQRFIHKSCLDPTLIDNLMKGSKEVEIAQLRRVRGEVRNYKIFAVEGSEKIEISADHPASVHGPGKVSFFLSLKISGPVAYNIIYEQ